MKHEIKDARLLRLIREGRKAARQRGHRIVQVYPSRNSTLFNGYMWGGMCKDCGAHVTCNAKPAPNEVPVMGSAVAADCKAE